MSKKESIKLNWSNPKLVNMANMLHYSEGRLDKGKLIKEGTKTLFYQLKKGGYIMQAENSKDIFKATDKLKRQYKEQINSKATWGGCGSSVHAQGMTQAVSLLPKAVIEEHRIKTEETLKEEFRAFKQTETYQERMAHEKQVYETLENKALEGLSHRQFTEGQYELQIENIRFLQNVIANERGLSVPDMEVTFTKEELGVFIGNLSERLDQAANLREYTYFKNAVQTLKAIEITAEREVAIGIEVITKTYGEFEIQAKMNYATICNKVVILLPNQE